MQPRLELGYLVIEVPEPDTLAPVFDEVVGLASGAPTESGTRTWRNDRRAHRLIVQPGPANDSVAIGFEAANPEAFETTVALLEATGLDLIVDADLAKRRKVDRLVRTRAPWGTDVEIVLGLADASTPFSSSLVPGGFLTEGVGLGHVVLVTPAFDESSTFLTDGLGFGQSDWLEMEIGEGIELEVRFFHCNARHHTVALARAPFDLPQMLHHVMFETKNRDDVGFAFDRLWASELGIANGLGRHDNDGMFSFYLTTPAGFQVEVGHGARVITEGWAENRRYDRISAWGHQALR
jgi:2,3-dihydroxybiphenyl 1,2-dioxygenase